MKAFNTGVFLNTILSDASHIVLNYSFSWHPPIYSSFDDLWMIGFI